jgi:hypothetical protein
MTASFIARELTIVRMAKALEPLTTSVINDRSERDARYVAVINAEVGGADPDAYDREALRRAMWHRDIMEVGKIRERNVA